MKKRFWAMFLAIAMVASMLPVAAFADHSEGDTLACLEKDLPNVDGHYWVDTGETQKVREDDTPDCGEVEGHTHSLDKCYKYVCEHDHKPDCYPNVQGSWVPCTRELNPDHYVPVEKVGEIDKDTRIYVDDNGVRHVVGANNHFVQFGDGCWVGSALYLASHAKWPFSDKWGVDDVVGSGEDALTNFNFYFYQVPEGTQPTCGHCSVELGCYELTCNLEAGHSHTDACFDKIEVPVWKLKKNLKVSYDANGGTGAPVDNKEYKSEDSVSVASVDKNTLTKALSVCIGFSKTKITDNVTTADAATAAELITSFTITADTTLYAVWAQDENGDGTPDYQNSKYNLTYDLNGGKAGTGPATENDKLPGEYSLSETTPKHDAVKDIPVVFVGWTTLADKTTKILGVEDTAPNTISKVTISNADVTVYAAWAYDTDNDDTPDYGDDKWTVTFNADGGSPVPNAQTVPNGGKAVEPTAPSKTDFNFDGWYLATGAEFDFDTAITADITLIAKWTADLPEVLTKKYDWVKVELNDNAAAAQALLDGLVPFVTVTHEDGTIVTAGSAKEWWGANPTKVLGKDLTGVKLGKGTDSIDLAIKGVVTKTDDYTVTLKDGGTIEFVSDPGIFKNLPEFLKKAIRGAVNLLPETADLSSIVEVINEAIKDANKIPGVEIPLIIGDNLPDVITKQDILNFLDKLFSDGVGSFTYMVITVEKANKPTPATYTVSFDANGGESKMDNQIFTKNEEQALTPNAFTKANCVFSGWNTKADGTGNAYTDKQKIKVTADMTLYAQWKEDKNHDGIADEDQKFTVVYKDGEDVLQTSEPLKVGVKTPAYNGTPKKNGYLFKGWEPTVAATIDAADADAKCFITYTAQWEKIVLNTTVFDFIHVHMDDATTADLNALKGEGAKHVRLESDKYDKVEALLGYRVMAPIGVKSNANWWTENFAKKVTAAEITNVILAADKPIGSSDKIVIPMAGNEKYTVTLGYELIDVAIYGADIDKILDELGKIQLPQLPDIDLDNISSIIDLIQTLKNMGLTYDQIFRLMEIVMDGEITPEEYVEILKILTGLNIKWDDIFEILNKLDKDDLKKLISALKEIDIAALAAKLQDLKEIISKLENIDCNDIEKALEQLKNAATKENIESALKQLKDALQRIDVDDLQSQLNELLAKLEKMGKEALIAKIKELIKNQIPEDALKCMTPEELKELLKGLITKHQYSLSCLCINISKNKAPDTPTDEVLDDLLKVTVVCDNTEIKPPHPVKTYGWIEGGVTLGKVVETETTWTCTATLEGWVYADAYNKYIGVDHPVTGVKLADPTQVPEIILTWNGKEWVPGNGVTFHVNCYKDTTVKHTVTFDYAYDSWVVRVLVEDGNTVTAPASGVERTGYVIDGWYLNSEKYDFATAVTSDITLVADWKVDRNNNGIADEYEYLTVTYSDGVANEVIFADQVHDTLLEGDATPAFDGTPSRIGYTFKGWKPEVSEIVTESVVYVAQWERNREPITPVGPTAPSVKVKYLNTEDHVAYIIGYENGTIRPRGEITRAEVATIFFRLMTDKARNQYWTTENDFNDVAEGQWFNLAVSTLNAAGVIVDAEYGNFRPNDPITRAELAVMAAQFCTVEGKLPKTSFTDVSKDHWAIDEIKLIEYAGWIEGYPDGTFRPDATITRAEAITIINRMLERAVEDSDMLEGMLTFIDCPTNEWFYEAVQEATNSHDYKRTKEEVEDYGYCYEIWTELEERPDWAAMEKTWLSQH